MEPAAPRGRERTTDGPTRRYSKRPLGRGGNFRSLFRQERARCPMGRSRGLASRARSRAGAGDLGAGAHLSRHRSPRHDGGNQRQRRTALFGLQHVQVDMRRRQAVAQAGEESPVRPHPLAGTSRRRGRPRPVLPHPIFGVSPHLAPSQPDPQDPMHGGLGLGSLPHDRRHLRRRIPSCPRRASDRVRRNQGEPRRRRLAPLGKRLARQSLESSGRARSRDRRRKDYAADRASEGLIHSHARAGIARHRTLVADRIRRAAAV